MFRSRAATLSTRLGSGRAVDAGAYVFQEYVRGLSDRMVTIGVYADRNHEVRGLFTGRKVRGYPPDIGDCKLGGSSTVPAWVKEIVLELAREIGLHGIAEFEFKQDAVSAEHLVTAEFSLDDPLPGVYAFGLEPSVR